LILENWIRLHPKWVSNANYYVFINAIEKYRIFSMINGYSGYNQAPIVEEDIHKIAFTCLGSVVSYSWIIMPFKLNNAETHIKWLWIQSFII